MAIEKLDCGWRVSSSWGGGVFGAIGGPSGSLDVALESPGRDLHLRRLAEAGGSRTGTPIQSMRQVHGPDVVVADDSASAALPECDALITLSGGPFVAGVTADCVPLLLHGPGAAAAVHAGWKGLACGVIEQAVAALADAAGSSPDQFEAHIGPCAGPCCYEVGDEVLDAIGLSAVHDGRMLASAATAARQLEELGVSRIADVGICTICADPELLASFRRDGDEAGRQGFIAWSS